MRSYAEPDTDACLDGVVNAVTTEAAECPVMRISPNWGKSLNASDYAALETSWITREIAHSAMLRRVDEYEGREIVGQKSNRDKPGTLIAP